MTTSTSFVLMRKSGWFRLCNQVDNLGRLSAPGAFKVGIWVEAIGREYPCLQAADLDLFIQELKAHSTESNCPSTMEVIDLIHMALRRKLGAELIHTVRGVGYTVQRESTGA